MEFLLYKSFNLLFLFCCSLNLLGQEVALAMSERSGLLIDFLGDVSTEYYTILRENDDRREKYTPSKGHINLGVAPSELLRFELGVDLAGLFDDKDTEWVGERNLTGATIEVRPFEGEKIVLIAGKLPIVAFGEKVFPGAYSIGPDKLAFLRRPGGVIGMMAKASQLPGFFNALEMSIFESQSGDFDFSSEQGFSVKLEKNFVKVYPHTTLSLSYINRGNENTQTIFEDSTVGKRESGEMLTLEMDYSDSGLLLGSNLMSYRNNTLLGDSSNFAYKIFIRYDLSGNQSRWFYGEYNYLDHLYNHYSATIWQRLYDGREFWSYLGLGATHYSYRNPGWKDEWFLGAQFKIFFNGKRWYQYGE